MLRRLDMNGRLEVRHCRQWCVVLINILIVLSMNVSVTIAQTALHIVAESHFAYSAATQTTTADYWATKDKTRERKGNVVIITRRDLGLRWVINSSTGKYSETRIEEKVFEQGTGEDLRTAGFSYEPQFSWTSTNSAQSFINGRVCRSVLATGTDDFAEMTLQLTLCRADGLGLENNANEFMLEFVRFRYRNPVDFAKKILAKSPGWLLMSLEATIEPPIAPTMSHSAVIRTMEIREPPSGIFELPPNVQSATIRR